MELANVDFHLLFVDDKVFASGKDGSHLIGRYEMERSVLTIGFAGFLFDVRYVSLEGLHTVSRGFDAAKNIVALCVDLSCE